MKFKIWILTGIIILTVFLIFFKLGKIPISLHGDEVGVGYNAYTLLKYGVDEYNQKFSFSMLALLSTLFISISPWHIQLSRIVHDAAYGLFLQLCGLTLFFK